MRIKKFVALLLMCFSISLSAQQAWQFDSNAARFSEQRKHIEHFQIAHLDSPAFQQQLLAAPQEFTNTYQRIYLPMPDASMQAFDIVASSVMEKGLEEKYPHFKTYAGYAPDRTGMNMRCSWTSAGFHAYIISSEGEVIIEALEKEGTYIIYDAKEELDEVLPVKMCGFTASSQNTIGKEEANMLVQSGEQLRLIRVAIATTGEYTDERGDGNVEATLATVVQITSALNIIFERDLTTRLLLVANNDRLIYSNAATDPYDADAFSMLQQNRDNLNSVIGRSNYDLGHVLGFNIEGGVAGVASFVGNFCTPAAASGVSGYFNNVARFIRTVAHEMGHQLGADHTWSNCGEDLNAGQRSGNTAVEPGSGSTIMSYAGSCLDNNIISTSYPFFHGMSIRQINAHLNQTGQCYDLQATGNTVPTASIDTPNGLYIPIRTPFELTATASDADGDELTYSWEQFDLDTISMLGSPIGDGPSFRAFQPSEFSTRIFPQRITIQFDREDETEVLPTYNRSFLFNVVVRDNRAGGGGVLLEQSSFRASDVAGPFIVTYPNAAETIWEEGEEVEITWGVANTDQAPINCETVDIFLSFNNGYTYADTIASNVPNTGSAVVTIPFGRTGTRVRLKVKAAENLFFDISNSSFSIVEATVAVKETSAANGLMVLPNPATEELWVEVEEASPEPMELRLFDTQGKLIQQHRFSTFGTRQVLNISKLEAGVYYLKSTQAGKEGVRKVVVQ